MPIATKSRRRAAPTPAETKQCSGCKRVLPISEFYWQARRRIHALPCKQCRREYSLLYYRRTHPPKPDTIITNTGFRLARGVKPAQPPTDAEARKGYHRTASSARRLLGNLVRRGKLVRPETCEVCGVGGRTLAHHDDYNQPAFVRWLCPKCHQKRHAELCAAAAAQALITYGLDADELAAPSADATCDNGRLRTALLETLRSLSPREREIMTLYYGIDDERAYTLEELGRQFGVTRERVRQIRDGALRKLACPPHGDTLRKAIS